MKLLVYLSIILLLGGAGCSKGQDATTPTQTAGLAWLYPVSPGIPGRAKTYICGSRAFDKSGTLVGKGSLTAQTKQAFFNITTALATVGLTLADVIQVNYTVKGSNGFSTKPDSATQSLLSGFDTAYFGVPPSITQSKSTTLIVQDDILIEIEVIAGK